MTKLIWDLTLSWWNITPFLLIKYDHFSNGHKQLNSINLISHRSHVLLFSNLHQLMPLLCLCQLKLAFQNVVYLRHQNCRVEILQTSFGTGVLLTNFLHTHRLISFWIKQHFYLFCSKKVKYDGNAAYCSPYLKGHQPKTTA